MKGDQQVRCRCLNVLHDEEGYECPVNNEDQIYILLKLEQTIADQNFEENIKETNKTKQSPYRHGFWWGYVLLRW